ncbi:LysR family transcriptional regulator [Photobacterium lipolyticum]|uniref:LysR family transcriptional regulator n=1 Tax=Photobacterium lipolyticum TaxID=266810 RepID=A0A2T3N432_9GAMM|nr:LysR family transcriptional regulator [Photobacterium lipolyticum]PSW07203.1 LysR family transcriptional regulator [Photobacterium lipolyticum]
MLPKTTIEQWIVLKTVTECGGYMKAAEVLNKSQSSVSYALNTLQERLGVKLLHVVGRKAELTEVGRTMLSQAIPLISAYNQLEQSAEGLKSGIRSSLNLVVNSIFPKSLLIVALKRFQERYPQTRIHLTEILRTESEKVLTDRNADLYITPLNPTISAPGVHLLDMDFIIVTAANHPLQRLPSLITANQLSQYPLITLTDKVTQHQEIKKVSAMSNWSFTTIEAVIEAVCQGVGYGWLPKAHIQPMLDSGKLKILNVSLQQTRRTVFYLVFGNNGQFYDKTVIALSDILKEEVENHIQVNWID